MTEREFTQLMQQYENLAYTVCHQLVHDHDLAQDLCQEAFLSVWLHRDRCPDTPDGRRNWVCRIAANKAKDHLKSAYARRVTAAEAPGDAPAAQAQALGASSLAEQVELRQVADAARGCIVSLAEPYRTVCALHFLGGVPADAIAARLNRPVKTVHTQLYRARLRMKRQLCAG